MATRFGWGAAVLSFGVVACSAHSDGGQAKGAGGTDGTGGTGGAGTTGGRPGAGGAGAPGTSGSSGELAFEVSIDASASSTCRGRCVDLNVTSRGGVAPITVSWSGAAFHGAGPHEVCPTETTTYVVDATDATRGSAEFPRNPRKASASITVTVDACTDGGVPSPVPDGGPEKPHSTSVLCSQHWPLLPTSSGLGPSVYGWGGPGGWGEDNTTTDPRGNVVLAAVIVGKVDFGSGSPVESAAAGLLVAKFDGNCKYLWSKVFQGLGSHVDSASVAVDADSSIVLGGTLTGSIAFGSRVITSPLFTNTMFLVKLNGSGNVTWTKEYSVPLSASQSNVYGVAVDASRDIVLTGYAPSGLDFGSGPVTVAGSPNTPFLARFSPDGTTLWSRTIPFQAAYSALAVTSDGIALSGYADSVIDWGGGSAISQESPFGYVSKLDVGGRHLWTRKTRDWTPGEFDVWGASVASDTKGNLIAGGGWSTSGTDGAPPAKLTKLSSAGEVTWSVDSPGHRYVKRTGVIATDAEDGVIELGAFEDTVTVDGVVLTADGAERLFVVKRASSSKLVWATRLEAPGDYYYTYGLAPDPDSNVFVSGVTGGEGGAELSLVKLAK